MEEKSHLGPGLRSPSGQNLHDRRGPSPLVPVMSPASPASPHLSRNTHLPTVLELPFSPSFLLPPNEMPSASPNPGQHPFSSLLLASTCVLSFRLLTCTQVCVSSRVPLPGLPTIHGGTGVTGPQCIQYPQRTDVFVC